MRYLKQSTAVDVMLGPFVDSTDGSTTEEALTLSQADLQLSKNGGAAAQKNDTTSGTHRYGGNYMIDLDATDTNTLGSLRLMCKESGALPIVADFMVIPANVYDSLIGGTDTLEVDTTLIEGVDATNQINAAADTAISDAALATAAALATVDSNVDAILVDTGTTIPAQITGLNDLSAAQVNAEVDTAIADAALATAASLATVDANVDAILVDTGTTIPAQITGLNNLSAAQVNAEVDTAIADAALATAANLATVDTNVDAILVDTSTTIPAQISGLNDISAAQVNAEVDTALADYDGPTKAELDAGLAALNDPTAAAIADAVLDEALAGHATAGTLGKAVTDIEADTNELQSDDVPGLIAALNNLSAAQVNAEVDTAIADAGLATSVALATVDAIVDAILVDTGTTIPGLIAALNDLSAAQVNAEVDTAITDAALATAANLATVDGIVDAILVDTATTIPGLIAALNDLSAAQVNAEVDTALADYDGPTKAELDAGLAALNDLSAAEVNAEVDTALADYDAPTKAELDAGLAALNDPTAAAIADAVLDEATAGHTTPGTVGAAIVDILADTNELQADDVPGLIAALNDVSIGDILQTQLTESYAADGTAPTLTQAVMLIMQHLTEVELVGTTWTTKKLDGTTTAATFTTDDANDPTSITRTG
jgi:DNA-binding transcriptional ArsR family regulator